MRKHKRHTKIENTQTLFILDHMNVRMWCKENEKLKRSIELLVKWCWWLWWWQSMCVLLSSFLVGSSVIAFVADAYCIIVSENMCVYLTKNRAIQQTQIPHSSLNTRLIGHVSTMRFSACFSIFPYFFFGLIRLHAEDITCDCTIHSTTKSKNSSIHNTFCGGKREKNGEHVVWIAWYIISIRLASWWKIKWDFAIFFVLNERKLKSLRWNCTLKGK